MKWDQKNEIIVPKKKSFTWWLLTKQKFLPCDCLYWSRAKETFIFKKEDSILVLQL